MGKAAEWLVDDSTCPKHTLIDHKGTLRAIRVDILVKRLPGYPKELAYMIIPMLNRNETE